MFFHTCDKYVDLIKKLAKKNIVTVCTIKQWKVDKKQFNIMYMA